MWLPVFWPVHLIGWLSLPCLVLFLELWSVFSFGPYFFLSWGTCYVMRGGALGVHQGGATHSVLWCCLWGRNPRRNNAVRPALRWLSVTSPPTHKQIGLFWCWFPVGWVCVCSRTLRVSPMNSPVRLGVSPIAAIPTGFYRQRFEALFPCAGTLSCVVSLTPHLFLLVYLHANVGQPTTAWPTWSSSCCLASCPLHPSCPSLPLLPIWMNISSLILWLSAFHTVWFSGSSGYFLFLNLLLSFFGCVRRQSVSTYASILARSLIFHIY